MALKDIKNIRYSISLFVHSMVELFLAGVIIYGWANLVVIFKFERFYLHLCPWLSSRQNISHQIHENMTNTMNISQLPYCPDQDRMFNLVFTICVKVHGVNWLSGGILIDKYGPLVASVGSGIMFLAAALTLSFTSVGNENLLFVSFILFGLVMNVRAGCWFKVCGVAFPRRKSLVLCLLCAVFDTSPVVFAIFKFMYDAGLGFQTVGLIYTSACAVVIVSGIAFFIPNQRKLQEWVLLEKIEHIQSDKVRNDKSNSEIPVSDTNVVLKTGSENGCEKENDGSSAGTRTLALVPSVLSSEGVATDESAKPKDKDTAQMQITCSENITTTNKNVKTSIMSSLYIFHLLFFCTIHLKMILFSGGLADELIRLSNNDDSKVSWYVNIFGYVQLGGLLSTPLIGIFVDRDTFLTHKKKQTGQPMADNKDTQREKLKQFIVPILVTIFLSIVLCVLGFFENIRLQILQYILFTIVRGFLYALHSAYVSVAFPIKHFGTLNGLGYFTASIFSLLNFPLFELKVSAFHGDPFYTNVVVLALVCFATSHPVNIWRKVRQSHVVSYHVFQ